MSRIKNGNKIKTPPENLIKEWKDNDGKSIWQFPYSNSYKRKGEDQYTSEKYMITVINFKPEPQTEYYVSNIIECFPQIAKSKDGRTFLNCVAYIEIDSPSNSQSKNESNNNIKNNNNVSDDDLPF